MATRQENSGLIIQGAAPRHGSYGEDRSAMRGNVSSGMAYGSGAWKTTVSVEFVAKPNESHHVHALVPAAIHAGLEGVTGFVGCAVMASSQEERLVTVLTFWQGDLTARAAAVNSRWVCKLLERYMDHRLRVQTMRTQLAFTGLEHEERDEGCVSVV